MIGTAAAIAMAIGSAASAGGAVYAAHEQAGAAESSANIQATAAEKAAELSAEAQANSLAFQKSQAENTFQNDEAVRQANYNQWAAETSRRGAIGQLFGLPAPNIPAYVPGIDPKYTSGGSTVPGSVGSMAPGTTSTMPGTASTTGTAASMPQGIDPRFAALYQQYGVTPGPRGSGAADWQYWQNDALANAGGDVNYVLGRLQQQLSGAATGGASSTASTSAAPGSIASWANPLTGSLPITTPLPTAPRTTMPAGYGIGGY